MTTVARHSGKSSQIELRRERESLSSSREALLREIGRLREDVREAERMRAEAVQHSSDLRERVLCLEKELSESRPAGAAGEIPLEALKGQLLRMWEEENFPEATRDLTEAAWARPFDEVVELVDWLMGKDGGAKLNAFVADVCRLRPVEEVIRFARELDDLASDHPLVGWVAAAASRVTKRNVHRFYVELRGIGAPPARVGDRLLAAAVGLVTEPSEAVALLVNATTGMTPPLPLRATARAVVVGRLWDRTFPFVVVVQLVKEGQMFLASGIIHDLFKRHGVTGVRSGYDPSRIFRGIEQLDTPTRDALFAFVAEMNSSRSAGEFAEVLFHGGRDDLRLLDQLLDALESHKTVDLLFAAESSGERVTSTELRRYVHRRHH
ncbi:hypothetical protein [Streptomyces tubercidicus]|uniref:hypothetical protein n=1 Tax=Streptomyces tubercidicus TaxID=47759 RepID=UPI0036CD8222